jgi:hypothetical protein
LYFHIGVYAMYRYCLLAIGVPAGLARTRK